MRSTQYTVRDLFNDARISRHRTLRAAVLSGRRHDRRTRKACGTGSPWGIFPTPDPVELADIEQELNRCCH